MNYTALQQWTLIHVATALDAGIDEFVTAEKASKPMFRVTKLRIQSIR
jgi:hypothetical protein